MPHEDARMHEYAKQLASQSHHLSMPSTPAMLQSNRLNYLPDVLLAGAAHVADAYVTPVTETVSGRPRVRAGRCALDGFIDQQEENQFKHPVGIRDKYLGFKLCTWCTDC